MFRPRIVGFVCKWSLPHEATVSRPSRIQGYPKIRIVPVTCLGGVDSSVVLEAFAKGSDGVLLIGCHQSECHYIEGNLQAERKINMLKKLITRTGLETERLRIDWAQPSEIKRFAEIIDSFISQVGALGPSPLSGEKTSPSMLANVLAAKAMVEGSRFRTLIGRENELVEKESVYGEKLEQESLDKVMDECMDEEYMRSRIQLLVKGKPMSVKGLSLHLGLSPREILSHVIVLRKRGLVALEKIEGASPLYVA